MRYHPFLLAGELFVYSKDPPIEVKDPPIRRSEVILAGLSPMHLVRCCTACVINLLTDLEVCIISVQHQRHMDFASPSVSADTLATFFGSLVPLYEQGAEELEI